MNLIDSKTDRLTHEALTALANVVGGPCVSIYMPTERFGPETQQSPIRLRNLLNAAAEQMQAQAIEANEAEAFLQPARTLVDTSEFWQHQSSGLALFLDGATLTHFRMPVAFPEAVCVSTRFHLKSILPLLGGDGHFFILTLNQNGVKLWQATRYELGEVALSTDTPASLGEELQYDVYPEGLQFHTGTGRVSRGERGAMFFGQGDAGDEAILKEQLLTFFRHLDNGVRTTLQEGSQTPLVLAGIDYLQGLYRQANQYDHLVETGIVKDAETMTPEELHEQAWALVEPHFAASRTSALDRYHHLAGTGDKRANQAIHDIVAAAYFQRIDTLFFAENTVQWGQFVPEQNRVITHTTQQPGDDDLLDLAAVHTWLNGGEIYPLPAAEMPTTNPAAAIFRY
jgi:hypothetical protein